MKGDERETALAKSVERDLHCVQLHIDVDGGWDMRKGTIESPYWTPRRTV